MTRFALPKLSYFPGVASLILAACSDPPREITRDSEPFNGIDEVAIITAGGTEPFWNLVITPTDNGFDANYSTPELIDGAHFSVTRFAGNNGLGFSGQMDAKSVNLALTPGECSDGMSDRTYPYTATLLLGDVTHYGCAHTDMEPFAEGETIP